MSREKYLKETTEEWTWVHSNGQTLVRNEAFRKYGFEHGFFTKASENKSPKELSESVKQGLSIHRVKQIHQSNIVKASTANKFPWPKADGLISDKKLQGLWIYSADCIPILFGDPNSGIFAAIHAGWKGISMGIVYKSINLLKSRGADINNLRIVMGPAISGKNYQVGFNVLESIYKSLSTDFENVSFTDKKMIDHMINLDIVQLDNSPKKFLLDIRLAASHQLCMQGIKGKQISICPYCTFKDKSLFNSWRREKRKAIQWSWITYSF